MAGSHRPPGQRNSIVQTAPPGPLSWREFLRDFAIPAAAGNPPVTRPAAENRILIAVAALLRPGEARPGADGTEVLIALRRPRAIRGGVWELPGGKASAGESAREAAARELLEETGVAVDPALGRELGTVEQDDPALPAERSLRLTLVAFDAPPGAAPRPLASVECRWERVEALDGYEWPAANRRLNAILAAACR